MAKININTDLRGGFSSIRDQGVRGTCLAFATTGVHEYMRKDLNDNNVILSPEALYWESRKLAGLPKGLTFSSVSSVLENHGQPEDVFWPYDPSVDENSPLYGPPADVYSKEFYKGSLEKIDLNTTSIISVIENGEPVICGVLISEPFFEDSMGIIRMPNDKEVIQQGHAIIIVGHGAEEIVEKKQYLIFRNSWGDEWGDHGYGYLPLEYYVKYSRGSYRLKIS